MNDEFSPLRHNSPPQDELTVKMLHEVSRNDHSATSFKMWDTLVLMPFSRNEDIFLFLRMWDTSGILDHYICHTWFYLHRDIVCIVALLHRWDMSSKDHN